MLKEGKFLLLGGSGGDDIDVYNSMAELIADLPNLQDGQFAATKDTGDELSQPVDTVEAGNLHAVTSNAVAESCCRFPDYANQIILQSGLTSWKATEDCFVIISQLTTSGVSSISIDGVSVGINDTTSNITINSFSGYIKKDQTIEFAYLAYSTLCKIFPLI
jgi:hypothetical protein